MSGFALFGDARCRAADIERTEKELRLTGAGTAKSMVLECGLADEITAHYLPFYGGTCTEETGD